MPVISRNNSRLSDADDVGVLLTRGYSDAHPGLSASPQSARHHMLRMTWHLVSQIPLSATPAPSARGRGVSRRNRGTRRGNNKI